MGKDQSGLNIVNMPRDTGTRPLRQWTLGHTGVMGSIENVLLQATYTRIAEHHCGRSVNRRHAEQGLMQADKHPEQHNTGDNRDDVVFHFRLI